MISEKLLEEVQNLSRVQKLELIQFLAQDLVVEEDDEDFVSKEEILATMKASLREALSGGGQTAREAIAELRAELAQDAD